MTPPPTPGKRRRRLRESVETDGEITIEAFKVMGPLLPKLVAVLEHHGIEKDKANLAMPMASKLGSPGGENPMLTLIVEVTNRIDIFPRVWSRCETIPYSVLT